MCRALAGIARHPIGHLRVLGRCLRSAACTRAAPAGALEGCHREALGVGDRARGVEVELRRCSPIAAANESTSSSATQPAGLAVEHRLERSAGGRGDHGPPGGLRLDRRDAELLHARHDHRARARVQLGELLVAGAPEELGLGVGLAAAPRGPVPSRPRWIGARARRAASSATCTRLWRDELGDDQQRVAGLARARSGASPRAGG